MTMATTDPVPDINTPPTRSEEGLLVLLAPMTPDQLDRVLGNLAASFPAENLLVASPDAASDALSGEAFPSLRMVAAPAVSASWTLTAADFVNAYQLASKNKARAILMLGPESGSLTSTAIHALGNAVLTTPTDLAVPCYDLPPHTGLVNSAILYPLTRALFASRVRFPLAVDLGLSIRMAERLANSANRFTALNQGETPLWPINEATVARFNIEQVDAGPRDLPQPAGLDLNTILPLVTGSLFSDIDSKAAFWQRFRQLPSAPDFLTVPHAPALDAAADIGPMLQAFRLAYTNLHEIWSLVLPPNTLLGLKRLSVTEAADFRMPESLWARIVFDFLLAHRLRTINRGHLLGALIPLYLAWVASHINITASGTTAETHIEAVAAAFEDDKAYLVSRWRWPDRFNP
jgi:phosphotransferase system HPr-like phosphotransfer protein